MGASCCSSTSGFATSCRRCARRTRTRSSSRTSRPSRTPSSRGGIRRRRGRTTRSRNGFADDVRSSAQKDSREAAMAATLPSVLVTTDWVAQHATDTGVRIVEVDVDTTAYDQGHVPGAAGWNWTTELCDTLIRDIVPIKKLEELLGKSGIDNKTTIVLYGDNNNWFAAWAFWQLKIYGHEDVRIMDGGRKKWLSEGRDLSTDKPSFPAKTYKAKSPDTSLRAF